MVSYALNIMLRFLKESLIVPVPHPVDSKPGHGARVSSQRCRAPYTARAHDRSVYCLSRSASQLLVLEKWGLYKIICVFQFHKNYFQCVTVPAGEWRTQFVNSGIRLQFMQSLKYAPLPPSPTEVNRNDWISLLFSLLQLHDIKQ